MSDDRWIVLLFFLVVGAFIVALIVMGPRAISP